MNELRKKYFNFGWEEYDRRFCMYNSRDYTKSMLCGLIHVEQRRIHGRIINPENVLMKDKKIYLVHHLVRLQRAKLQRGIVNMGF